MGRRRRRSSLLLLGGAGATAIEWLLNDDFSSDEAAPLTSPRTAEPGPGTLTFDGGVTTDVSTQSSELRIEGTAEISGAYGAITRVQGMVAMARVRRLTTEGTGNNRVYVSPIGSGSALSMSLGATTGATGLADIMVDGSSSLTQGIEVAEDTFYRFAFVARSAGFAYFVDNRLFWIRYDDSSDIAPGFWRPSNRAHTGFDWIRVRQLPAPFDTDDGIASVYEETAAADTDYTATADAIHDLTVTAPNPLAESAGLYYRYTDDDNTWRAYFDSAGAFRTDSISGGSATNRVNVASAIVADGTRTIRAICEGNIHNLFTLSGTTWTRQGGLLDVNHQNAVTTIRPQAGTGWTLGALRSYPRTSTVYNELGKT